MTIESSGANALGRAAVRQVKVGVDHQRATGQVGHIVEMGHGFLLVATQIVEYDDLSKSIFCISVLTPSFFGSYWSTTTLAMPREWITSFLTLSKLFKYRADDSLCGPEPQAVRVN